MNATKATTTTANKTIPATNPGSRRDGSKAETFKASVPADVVSAVGAAEGLDVVVIGLAVGETDGLNDATGLVVGAPSPPPPPTGGSTVVGLLEGIVAGATVGGLEREGDDETTDTGAAVGEATGALVAIEKDME